MEVTLVKPHMGSYRKIQLSMAMLYLATHLHRSGHKVRIVDCQIDSNPEKTLSNYAETTDCFGFSVMTTQIGQAIQLSDFIKDIDPKVPVVWGGIHPTIHPEQTIKDKSVDYVVRGEGEQTFAELCLHLEGKMDAEKIKGLVYQKNGRILVNPERPFMDLNALSPPEWGLFEMEKYVQDFEVAGVSYGKSLPVHSGRGCTYGCTFCISARKWRPLSSKNILNEVSVLKERYGVEHIDFVDENFFINRSRVEEFAKGLLGKRLDLKWFAACRANYFNESHVNSELLALVKKAGCRTIGMGIESGSQRMLDMMKKEITVDDTLRAVKACSASGMQPVCAFMVGLPTETRDDMDQTVDLIIKIRKLCPNALIIGPQVFRPYPGCEIYDMVKDKFSAPETLRDWTKLDPMGRYTTADRLTWVKQTDYVKNVGFYVLRSNYRENYSAGQMWVRLVDYPLKKMAEFRLRHKMFGFPFERSLFQKGQNIYYGLKTI